MELNDNQRAVWNRTVKRLTKAQEAREASLAPLRERLKPFNAKEASFAVRKAEVEADAQKAMKEWEEEIEEISEARAKKDKAIKAAEKRLAKARQELDSMDLAILRLQAKEAGLDAQRAKAAALTPLSAADKEEIAAINRDIRKVEQAAKGRLQARETEVAKYRRRFGIPEDVTGPIPDPEDMSVTDPELQAVQAVG